ncbi:GNAT family N-acetyltransferase [Planotetraspora sp. A-T 1434]|uniref:GNAT family N-acetyltransferase n=1 Tax=Planotetraspora sp. A-T 1434 TaxID=2979219 RepID=UPI0021C03271|nr:GNAT family N-acetyltransferase [Planotetraspora sp. A-T 1434]MCT9933083.1 GNAT family N-acetyltransferase [Planotetraspora sp. A-T 1434]
MVRELRRVAEVVDASGDDDLIVWAAQGMKPGVRAWASGDAVAVASPAASRRDRLAVSGSAAHAIPLVRHALAESGPSFRPLGDAALVHEVVQGIDEVELIGGFSWMLTTSLTSREVVADARGVAWLGEEDEPDVTDLLKTANPDSYAMPGIPEVRRWAGIRDAGGELVAVAADAWSAPTVGLLAGVATAVSARGHGLGERVCRFVVSALLAEHGRAALMVDDWNRAAIIVYERLGFSRRGVAAAGVRVSPSGAAASPASR